MLQLINYFILYLVPTIVLLYLIYRLELQGNIFVIAIALFPVINLIVFIFIFGFMLGILLIKERDEDE